MDGVWIGQFTMYERPLWVEGDRRGSREFGKVLAHFLQDAIAQPL